MMIQVPASKLARGDATGKCVQSREEPLDPGPGFPKCQIMDQFMKKDDEAQDCEPLPDSQGNPIDGLFDLNQKPQREAKGEKQPESRKKMTARLNHMEFFQLLMWNGLFQPRFQVSQILVIVSGGHGG